MQQCPQPGVVPSGAGPSAAPSEDLGLGVPSFSHELHPVLRWVIRRVKAFFFSSEKVSLKERPQA